MMVFYREGSRALAQESGICSAETSSAEGRTSTFSGPILCLSGIPSLARIMLTLMGRRVLKGLNSVTGRDRPQRGLRGPASSRTAILSPQYKHELLSPSGS